MIVSEIDLQSGDRGLFERTLADHRALLAGPRWRVITRADLQPRNPGIAIALTITLENGETRPVIAELDYQFFTMLARRLDTLYAENPEKH